MSSGQKSRFNMKIPEYYDKLSERYSELYGMEQQAKHEKILQWIQGQPCDVLVDIGCGDGEFLCRIDNNSCLTVGVDSSLGMLRRAKTLLSGKSDLVWADAGHLPFRGGSADCITSVSVIDLGSAEVIIAEASRISRSGGSIILSLLHPGAKHFDPSTMSQDLRRVLVESCPLSVHETLYFLRMTGQR